MNINILEKMNKVPGGLIIIPLLAAILINTFAPEVLGIGGPTTAPTARYISRCAATTAMPAMPGLFPSSASKMVRS